MLHGSTFIECSLSFVAYERLFREEMQHDAALALKAACRLQAGCTCGALD